MPHKFKLTNNIEADLEELTAMAADLELQKLQIESLASGSPKGSYETLVALEAAHPTGDTGIYVVVEDGNWYYWDGTAWMAGGTYQSTEWLDILTEQDEAWEVA